MADEELEDVKLYHYIRTTDNKFWEYDEQRGVFTRPRCEDVINPDLPEDFNLIVNSSNFVEDLIMKDDLIEFDYGTVRSVSLRDLNEYDFLHVYYHPIAIYTKNLDTRGFDLVADKPKGLAKVTGLWKLR